MNPFQQQTKRVKCRKKVTHRFPLYCHSSKTILKKTKDFSWGFVQSAENGTTKDAKIFLWSSFVTKKKLLYGSAQTVNKSRKMPNRTFLLNFEVAIHWWGMRTHCKQKNGSFKSHIYMKSCFGQFWNKIENVVFVFRTFLGKYPQRSSFLEK